MASPTPAQRPAEQRSAKESRQEFETRMMNTVSLLESTDTIFFYKHVSKSMATEVVHGPFAYSLEFPIDFIKQHGKKFDKEVTFLMKDNQRTWPIKLTMRSFKQSKRRVFAYGPGGWKSFVMDNRIEVGDFLIFSLINFLQFEVVIGRAPVGVHADDDDDDNEDVGGKFDKSSAKWFRNTWPWWNADQAPVCCPNCKQVPSCPRFLVSICPLSHPRHLSLAVPGYFWFLHGSMLRCNDLQLRGPNKAIFTVKAKRTYDVDEEKLNVCLESGWEAFLVANELRVGDILEFFLVGNSCFTVDLLERVEEH